jgi:hypothetical protein
MLPTIVVADVLPEHVYAAIGKVFMVNMKSLTYPFKQPDTYEALSEIFTWIRHGRKP